MNNSSEAEFEPSSFIIFSIDKDKNAACELAWGTTKEDIKNFSILLQAITTGQLNDSILKLLEMKSKEEKGGKTALKTILQNFKPDDGVEDDLVVDPLSVEIFT